jgi:hypothetical protein
MNTAIDVRYNGIAIRSIGNGLATLTLTKDGTPVTQPPIPVARLPMPRDGLTPEALLADPAWRFFLDTHLDIARAAVPGAKLVVHMPTDDWSHTEFAAPTAQRAA